MSSSTIVRLVAMREIKDRLRNKAFMITTVVVLLAIVGGVVIPTFFRDDGPTTYELGTVGALPPGFEPAATAAADLRGADIEITAFSDRATAEGALADGDVAAVLIDAEQLLVEDEPDDALRDIVDGALGQAQLIDELDRAGIDATRAQELLGGREPVAVTTLSGETQQEREAGFGIGFVATVLLFLMIQINAGTLLTGTIEEKSSRVVEVLLGTVRPWQLLAGKLAGISVLAIGQLIVYVAALLGANAAVDAFELPPATTGAVLSGVLLFVVGFGFYAALYAVAGSLASSVEDAQSSAGPLGFLVTAVYFAVIIGVVPNPDGILARVLTYLPPSAPFTIPARVAADAIAAWEVVAGAVLTAVGTVLTVRLAGRLYSAALLAGGKLTWREVFKAEPIT